MSAVVFLGPTLPLEVARSQLDAVYLPPAQKGDVLCALSRRPRVIAIVDGYFDDVPSVWHKEILSAMTQGVHVFGAASMGALRAAELHPFGMVGVGEVFGWFRDGELEDDDEVAVIHRRAESGFLPLSDAMVDIRDGISAAVAAGVIDRHLGTRLAAAAKSLHYSDRSFRRMLHDAREGGEDPVALEALSRFLDAPAPKVKERDARTLLQTLDAFLASDPPPLRVGWELERTGFLAALEQEVGAAQETRGSTNSRAAAICRTRSSTIRVP